MAFKDAETRRAYHKKYYSENPDRKEYLKEKTRKRRKLLRVWLQNLKATLKCEQCPEDHSACLEFHHRDPSEKDRIVSDMVGTGTSIKRMLDEINKCDVLCSNCHRKLHAAHI